MYVTKTRGFATKLGTTLTVLILSLIAVGMPAAPVRAQGSGPLLECVGTHTATYSPGVTSTPQSVTVSAKNLFVCPLSLVGTASYETTFTSSLSCDSLLQQTPFTTRKINWGDGETSTAQLSQTGSNINGTFVVTLQGKITAGLYEGNNVVITVTDVNLLATLQNDCASSGVTSSGGPSTLTITPI
ncbi:hypothetical protein [Dyella sp.]|uniref:hypothetical protein n=1 Tax=Dyella sp. TaxID=1869338 RepID=UPI002D767CD6|nr:hypothetical protein [Dyella sp.]HET7332997.1 hypothetical protein [Dyella sp.]